MAHTLASRPLLPPWPDLLPLHPTPVIPAEGRSLFLWGDRRIVGLALRTAARALTRGLQVAVVDAGMAFQVTPVVATAQACRIAQTVPAHQTPRRVFARNLLRVVDVGLRLMPGADRWSVDVVKPRPSPHGASEHRP